MKEAIEMYSVYQVYQDFEPWWFFPEWKDNIKVATDFNNLEDAQSFFLAQVAQLKSDHDNMIKHDESTYAFYDNEDFAFCEDCADDVQMYYGLLLIDHENPPVARLI